MVIDHLISKNVNINCLIDDIEVVMSAYESEDKKRIKKLENTVEEISGRILY